MSAPGSCTRHTAQELEGRNLESAVTLANRTHEPGAIVMDWNRLEGSWKQTTGKIREKWGKLTDDDLTQINGRRDQFEGQIQERYGVAKDRVRKDVDDWLNSLG
jgi:uncharacterized protein YjbJ (UPF0337 family)